MKKTDLPVLILKQIILLPENEMKIEFNNDISKNIIDIAELFHNNKVFVVSLNDKEENIDTTKFPKVGVIAKFINKMVLPNGKVRITLKTITRAVVHEYLNHSQEILEAIVSKVEKDIKEDTIVTNKIYKEIERFSTNIPYISNIILPKIKKTKDLSKITDIIAQNITTSYDRLYEYLNTLDIKLRIEMILEDIYKEEQVFKIEKEIDNKVKKEIDSSQKEFILKEKIKAIKQELGEISDKEEEIIELETKIDNLKCPIKIKNKLKKELNKYQSLPNISPEASITKTHIEYLLTLPWQIKTKDNQNLNKAKEILDKNHYGLEKAKQRIIEYLAVKKITNKLSGTILCLIGPPGVGKTTLAKSIAQSMNRNFVKISVGGVDDTAEIIGHRKTYIGALPGRIISSIKKAGTNNPVFLIDEIDKLSKSINGDPASALLEVLDIEQNKHFVDNYVEEEFDLSNVLFVLTANYIEDIPYALKDRLEIIELSSYTEFEKLSIAKKHLIPKICIQNGLKELKITDKEILYIIRNYTKEAGVRCLFRVLDEIVRKIITNYVTTNKLNNKVTIKNIDNYLGNTIINTKIENNIGVANGLAYTSYGGDLLPIEVTSYKGKGEIILTGSLGEVMKESAVIALSYIKSNYKYFKIDYKKITENDIHIHAPQGAIPKDGPSAGITLTTALLSLFKNEKTNSEVAMTGEITLHGDILPIGGLKEKSIGAIKNNIKKIIIPYDNLNETKDFPPEIKNNIEYIPVKNYKEAIKHIFMEK